MSYGKSKSAETRVTPIMQAGARGPFRGVNGAGKASERPGRTWAGGRGVAASAEARLGAPRWAAEVTHAGRWQLWPHSPARVLALDWGLRPARARAWPPQFWSQKQQQAADTWEVSSCWEAKAPRPRCPQRQIQPESPELGRRSRCRAPRWLPGTSLRRPPGRASGRQCPSVRPAQCPWQVHPQVDGRARLSGAGQGSQRSWAGSLCDL